MMLDHCADPLFITQAEIRRKLKLKQPNDFYRLFYKVMKEESLKNI